jgi:hypothetical protein
MKPISLLLSWRHGNRVFISSNQTVRRLGQLNCGRDGNQGELLIALPLMAKAFGGMQVVAEKAQLNPTQI